MMVKEKLLKDRQTVHENQKKKKKKMLPSLDFDFEVIKSLK